MKSKIVQVVNGELQWECLTFICPGCKELGSSGIHQLPINTNVVSPSWKFDGNLEAPTLEPSILSNGDDPARRCHSYLRAGVFEFLTDCAHSFAGTKVAAPDLPDWLANG